MKILFSFLPKSEQQQSLVEKFPEMQFFFRNDLDEELLKSAQIFVTYGEDLHPSHIQTATHLQWIMVASAGLEKMPLEAIASRGIVVTNVRGIHKIPMAESILAHILSIKKSFPVIAENQRKSNWFKKVKSSELYDSTALILGPGAIGGEVGRILRAFGVHTIGCNRSGNTASFMDDIVSFDSLKEVLPKVDIVISLLPSTKETRHLLTYEHFQRMKKTAIFMNFGRGDVIREEELIRALRDGCIETAVLDVFENEPLQEEHPFWKMDNVIISPHVSSHSSQYVVRALHIFSKNLKEWISENGCLENIIDLEKGY